METIKISLKQVIYILIIGALSSFSLVTSNNSLKNKTFRVNGNAFETIGRESYTIIPFIESKSYSYGNFIKFSDSTFHSYYSAPCGNDCFTDVEGTYTFLTDSTIHIFVNAITKSGDCRMNEEYTKGDFGIYTLSNYNNNTITLTKKV